MELLGTERRLRLRVKLRSRRPFLPSLATDFSLERLLLACRSIPDCAWVRVRSFRRDGERPGVLERENERGDIERRGEDLDREAVGDLAVAEC